LKIKNAAQLRVSVPPRETQRISLLCEIRSKIDVARENNDKKQKTMTKSNDFSLGETQTYE